MLTGSPYTNYATFADPVNGQTYPRQATMDSGGASIVIEYQSARTWARSSSSRIAAMTPSSPTTATARRSVSRRRTTSRTTTTADRVAVQRRRGIATSGSNWTTGLFFLRLQSRAYNTTEFEAFNYTGALANFVANDGYTTDHQSAFVHANYGITERFAVSGGLRYRTRRKPTRSITARRCNRSDVPLIFGDSRTDWKAELRFRVDGQRLPLRSGRDGLQLGSRDAAYLHGRAAHGARRRGATEHGDRGEARVPRPATPSSTRPCFRATTTRASARPAASINATLRRSSTPCHIGSAAETARPGRSSRDRRAFRGFTTQPAR